MWTIPARPPVGSSTPIWGRTLDVFEIILIVGAIPVAVWVSGLYAWARALHA